MYHIITYILSQDEDHKYDAQHNTINNLNRSFRLVQNNSHTNFYLIDLLEEKKNIDIGQIRETIAYTHKSSFNNKQRIILIDNVEYLNKNAINALLKVIEEPNQNIHFILIHNNEKKILPTLKSRCLTFKINLKFNETIKTVNSILGNDIFELINHSLINLYSTPGEFINLINFSKEKKIDLTSYSINEFLNLLIDNGYYKKNRHIKKLLISFIQLYFLKEYNLTNSKNLLIRMYQNFIQKINDTEKYNLDEESLFLEFKSNMLNG